jgi:DNA-directed RNA polymerase subunit RPC12/RpoP
VDQKKPDRVGIRTAFGVRGDFTMTVGFEFLEVERPKAGAGVGVLLYLITDYPKEAGLAFFRIRRVTEGETYLLSRRTYIPDAKQRYEDEFVAATSEWGRLRVTREGANIVVEAAEGNSDAFRELRRYEWDKADLKRVELTAYPGRAPNAVVVRVMDLQIRAESLPGLPDLPDAPPPTGSRIGLVIGLMLAFGLTAALAVYLSRRRKTVPARPAAATPALISFVCPACGKGLKARADRAGKAVKCPHCEQAVSVPDAVADERPRQES